MSFNCAQYASNPELLAANLFGYVKGAFTGAQSDKAGRLRRQTAGCCFSMRSIARMLRDRRSCSPAGS
nr:Phage shock protein F [Klebsiella pneumoniae]